MNSKYIKGSVWWVFLPIQEGTHIQGGARPCVIVTDTTKTPNSGVVTVCPLSTKVDGFSSHPNTFFRGKAGQILCEQIVTIDTTMIGDYVGQLRAVDEVAMNYTLKELLGI